jgi:hypothetical protein
MIDLIPLYVSATIILVVIIVAVGVVRTLDLHYIRVHDQATSDEIAGLKQRIVTLSMPVSRINAAFQETLVRQLTHFHTPVLDALLAKIGPPYSLSDEEYQQLVAALKEREKDMGDKIDNSEREAAKMLPIVIRRVAEEKNVSADLFDLILVAVPKSDSVAK